MSLQLVSPTKPTKQTTHSQPSSPGTNKKHPEKHRRHKKGGNNTSRTLLNLELFLPRLGLFPHPLCDINEPRPPIRQSHEPPPNAMRQMRPRDKRKTPVCPGTILQREPESHRGWWICIQEHRVLVTWHCSSIRDMHWDNMHWDKQGGQEDRGTHRSRLSRVVCR